ncbi:MAG: response regulator transcription factor [Chlamydiae bacterium]|nr:response regulator transcription factor [Chlamydiota bacterium]MBI3276592.1 response regulator transcription factor [Chlamydiota bacterium]
MKAKKNQPKARIFIVDDHPIVRQGLIQLINQESDLVPCGNAEDACQALENIEKLKPDVAVVDISLKGMNGLDLIKNLKVRCPHLPILVLSMYDESIYAERVLRAGAKGYIMKQEATEKVLVAIRRVLEGQVYVSEVLASKIIEKLVNHPTLENHSDMDRLSDRELEVFQLIGKGYGTRQVAKELHLSVKTIETYREKIKEKLDLENATALVRSAVQWVQSENVGGLRV